MGVEFVVGSHRCSEGFSQAIVSRDGQMPTTVTAVLAIQQGEQPSETRLNQLSKLFIIVNMTTINYGFDRSLSFVCLFLLPGFTPLMYACESGNAECVELLLGNGASIKCVVSGYLYM